MPLLLDLSRGAMLTIPLKFTFSSQMSCRASNQALVVPLVELFLVCLPLLDWICPTLKMPIMSTELLPSVAFQQLSPSFQSFFQKSQQSSSSSSFSQSINPFLNVMQPVVPSLCCATLIYDIPHLSGSISFFFMISGYFVLLGPDLFLFFFHVGTWDTPSPIFYHSFLNRYSIFLNCEPDKSLKSELQYVVWNFSKGIKSAGEASFMSNSGRGRLPEKKNCFITKVLIRIPTERGVLVKENMCFNNGAKDSMISGWKNMLELSGISNKTKYVQGATTIASPYICSGIQSKLSSPGHEKLKTTKAQVSWLWEIINHQISGLMAMGKGMKESSPPSGRVRERGERGGFLIWKSSEGCWMCQGKWPMMVSVLKNGMQLLILLTIQNVVYLGIHPLGLMAEKHDYHSGDLDATLVNSEIRALKTSTTSHYRRIQDSQLKVWMFMGNIFCVYDDGKKTKKMYEDYWIKTERQRADVYFRMPQKHSRSSQEVPCPQYITFNLMIRQKTSGFYNFIVARFSFFFLEKKPFCPVFSNICVCMFYLTDESNVFWNCLSAQFLFQNSIQFLPFSFGNLVKNKIQHQENGGCPPEEDISSRGYQIPLQTYQKDINVLWGTKLPFIKVLGEKIANNWRSNSQNSILGVISPKMPHPAPICDVEPQESGNQISKVGHWKSRERTNLIILIFRELSWELLWIFWLVVMEKLLVCCRIRMNHPTAFSGILGSNRKTYWGILTLWSQAIAAGFFVGWADYPLLFSAVEESSFCNRRRKGGEKGYFGGCCRGEMVQLSSQGVKEGSQVNTSITQGRAFRICLRVSGGKERETKDYLQSTEKKSQFYNGKSFFPQHNQDRILIISLKFMGLFFVICGDIDIMLKISKYEDHFSEFGPKYVYTSIINFFKFSKATKCLEFSQAFIIILQNLLGPCWPYSKSSVCHRSWQSSNLNKSTCTTSIIKFAHFPRTKIFFTIWDVYHAIGKVGDYSYIKLHIRGPFNIPLNFGQKCQNWNTNSQSRGMNWSADSQNGFLLEGLGETTHSKCKSNSQTSILRVVPPILSASGSHLGFELKLQFQLDPQELHQAQSEDNVHTFPYTGAPLKVTTDTKLRDLHHSILSCMETCPSNPEKHQSSTPPPTSPKSTNRTPKNPYRPSSPPSPPQKNLLTLPNQQSTQTNLSKTSRMSCPISQNPQVSSPMNNQAPQDPQEEAKINPTILEKKKLKKKLILVSFLRKILSPIKTPINQKINNFDQSNIKKLLKNV
ncbi:hypothetical protein VP01_1627g1 [Puccinia sorghi]|uniref:Uncharacterized protein n=1 Tax=Puccinia sorghi TaxID=27349 RepID=A0A0L6VGV5_9BASI|nr:hypothetical protein VP01_1627g1 [Puccinia sorghi]